MTRFRRLLDDVLWGPETGTRLVVVHIGLSILIGYRIVFGPYPRLAGTPEALFDPVPILAWLGRMPPLGVIVALQVVGAVAAVAAALRRRTRVTFAVAWVCYLVLAALFGSRGKVMHNDLLLLWVSAVFLLAPVEARLADREPSRAHGWPVRVATAVAATIYFLTGYHKLRRSGIDWAIGDNFRYIMLWGPTYGRPHWEAMAEWIGEHLWAARTSSTFLLGLELSFPLALVFRRLQWVWALAAAFVHLATWVLLGLDYWAWTATVLLVFIDWPAVADRLRGRPAVPVPAVVEAG